MNKKILAACIQSILYRGNAIAAYSPYQTSEEYNWHYMPITQEELLRRVLASGKNLWIKDSRWRS